jgi:prevent-host-death family protein
MRSEDARNNWREMIDTAYRGGEVVVERHGKAVAVLIGHDEWRILRNQRIALLKQLSADAAGGRYHTLEEAEQGLRERGLID